MSERIYSSPITAAEIGRNHRRDVGRSRELVACPINVHPEIMSIPNIIRLSTTGNDGAVREFAALILENQ